MKNNTQNTKELLMKALNSLPSDFALGDTKIHIKTALAKLEQVEKKREKREISHQQRINSLPSNPVVARQSIDMIDELIEQEKLKIEEIQKRKIKKNDEEGEQPLLG